MEKETVIKEVISLCELMEEITDHARSLKEEIERLLTDPTKRESSITIIEEALEQFFEKSSKDRKNDKIMRDFKLDFEDNTKYPLEALCCFNNKSKLLTKSYWGSVNEKIRTIYSEWDMEELPEEYKNLPNMIERVLNRGTIDIIDIRNTLSFSFIWVGFLIKKALFHIYDYKGY